MADPPSPACPRGASAAGKLHFINRFYWPDLSATSQMLTDLAGALAGRGHCVSVITSRQRIDQPGAALTSEQTHHGVRVRRVWTTRFGRHWLPGRAVDYLTFYLSVIARVLRQVQPGDVVVAKTDPPLLGVVVGPFVRLKRARLVNWWQDVYPEVAVRLGVLPERSLLTRLFLFVRDRVLRSAAHNVALGERMRQHLLGVASDAPVTVIPNWSPNLVHTPSPADDNPYRRQLRLQGKVVFAYSGNLGRAHPLAALLEAGRRLRAQADLHFLMIGSGARWQSLQDQVRQAQLRNWSFLPPQPREQLADSLGAADVHFVVLDPALEGLIVPSKIYGILAAGRPTLFIGDAKGEVAALLQRHACGVTAAPDNPDDLERAIRSLAGDRALRARLGANARRAFESAHRLEHAESAWSRILEG